MEIDKNLEEEFIKNWMIVTLNTLRPEGPLNPTLEERGESMTIFVNASDGRDISLQILPYETTCDLKYKLQLKVSTMSKI